MQKSRLSMPLDLLASAVKLAGAPCEIVFAEWAQRTEHPAVKIITDWWNTIARPEFRSAHSFAFYVQYDGDWLSSEPAEGWVSADNWAKTESRQSEATLLDGRVVFKFFTHSLDEGDHGFDARAVDGSHGCSGKRWKETSGDAMMTFDSYAALSHLPVRFFDVWEICNHAR